MISLYSSLFEIHKDILDTIFHNTDEEYIPFISSQKVYYLTIFFTGSRVLEEVYNSRSWYPHVTENKGQWVRYEFSNKQYEKIKKLLCLKPLLSEYQNKCFI